LVKCILFSHGSKCSTMLSIRHVGPCRRSVTIASRCACDVCTVARRESLSHHRSTNSCTCNVSKCHGKNKQPCNETVGDKKKNNTSVWISGRTGASGRPRIPLRPVPPPVSAPMRESMCVNPAPSCMQEREHRVQRAYPSTRESKARMP